MLISAEAKFVLNQKTRYFKERVYDACMVSESEAYAETCRLSPMKRRTLILTRWDEYREQQLVPLVQQGVTAYSEILRCVSGSAPERADAIRRHITDETIQEAINRVRNWFRWACDGPLRIDARNILDLKGQLDKWVPPQWLEPPRYKVARKKGKWLLYLRDKPVAIREEYALQFRVRLLAHSEQAAKRYILHREAELFARLGFVLELSIGENAEKLLPLAQTQAFAPTLQGTTTEADATRIQQPPTTDVGEDSVGHTLEILAQDYSRLKFNDRLVELTPQQRLAVGFMHRQHLDGKTISTSKAIHDAVGSKRPMSEIFRDGHPLWKTLIRRLDNRRYRLALPGVMLGPDTAPA
jgi:hypothetical protein